MPSVMVYEKKDDNNILIKDYNPVVTLVYDHIPYNLGISGLCNFILLLEGHQGIDLSNYYSITIYNEGLVTGEEGLPIWYRKETFQGSKLPCVYIKSGESFTFIGEFRTLYTNTDGIEDVIVSSGTGRLIIEYKNLT